MSISAIKTLLIIVTGLLTACASQPESNGIPQWLSNPDKGVVASCGFHIGGHYQQQECAIQRGRERLAAEQGVEVSSVSVIKERVINGNESVVMDKETTSNVMNKSVKARVQDSYYDVQRDEYYVWVVPN
jgi:outer membrane lipopolysaccharide assembly protein LptE/RlpB